MDGHIEEPFEPLVLLFGAEDFALVLHHRVFNGAKNLLGGRCQPVVKKHVQQLQFGHLSYRCLQRRNVLLFTSTHPEVKAHRLLRAGCQCSACDCGGLERILLDRRRYSAAFPKTGGIQYVQAAMCSSMLCSVYLMETWI